MTKEQKIELGDRLFGITFSSQGNMFKIGEMVQLSYNAFELMVRNINEENEKEIKLQFPLGLRSDGHPIIGENVYTQKDIAEHYSHLANEQLPLNGIYQLVTITETMFGDTIKEILLKHPKKIGEKRSISYSSIFESSSLEAVHLTAISAFMNELSYKSPHELAEEASKIYSFNLLEIPAYHRFIEINATRDIFIHERGMANTIYKKKAASLARVEPGKHLPMDTKYFLESYEFCIQLTEVLMEEFNKVWPSKEFIIYKESITPKS